MSACLIAMVVLGILSVFSARYRYWAKEAFFCVGRRITLRPCDTGFDQKVRSRVTSAIMKRHRGIARAVHRHFEAISWVFTISLFVSLFYTGYSVYNLASYGTCDPMNPDECVFNPDLPVCEIPECTGHCWCNGVEVGCNDPLFEACDGDCSCVCSGGDAITGLYISAMNP
jgi:hypothetical protein